MVVWLGEVEKGEKVKEIASGTGIANERLRGGKHLIAHTTHSEIWILHTQNRPHRTNNGVLNVCVTWKITKNLKKEAMLFQWFYVEFAISVEIFVPFYIHSTVVKPDGRQCRMIILWEATKSCKRQ